MNPERDVEHDRKERERWHVDSHANLRSTSDSSVTSTTERRPSPKRCLEFGPTPTPRNASAGFRSLGYADTAFYKTDDGAHYPLGRHPEGSKDVEEDLERVVSFVDAPGHETLMAITITGASLMDGALLMVAANEACPQPQTREHLMALEIAGIENIVVVQNKIDLVTRERALESHAEIKAFLKGTIAEDAPIIPVSAHHDVNLDVLISAIEAFIPTPDRSEDVRSVMHVARSFDINRPGTDPAKCEEASSAAASWKGPSRSATRSKSLQAAASEKATKPCGNPSKPPSAASRAVASTSRPPMPAAWLASPQTRSRDHHRRQPQRPGHRSTWRVARNP